MSFHVSAGICMPSLGKCLLRASASVLIGGFFLVELSEFCIYFGINSPWDR